MNKKRIGNLGEKQVAGVLHSLPSSDFKLFNNVMFKTAGGTTQIDHLLVSTRGIFVIETKAHKGKICGDASSSMWVQSLHSRKQGLVRNNFYNPYRQNRGHLDNVVKLLGTHSVCGIICFTSDSVDLSSVCCESVYPLCVLHSVIENIFISSNWADYSFSDMCAKVSRLNIQSAYFDRKHIKYVKSLTCRGSVQ